MKNIDVYRLSLVKEREVPYQAISCPDDVKFILGDLGLGSAAEEFTYLLCLCTNAKGHIASIFEVSHSEFTSSIVHPREVFKRALLCNSAAVILAHNHPSGDPTPSSEDDTVTHRLAEAGELLGVPSSTISSSDLMALAGSTLTRKKDASKTSFFFFCFGASHPPIWEAVS